ncbi:MAG: glutamine-hydrolyzing carbamoyl-phosphate synthase small subunit [Candidatus Marinimicrobia bacterium]|nr:glutamine-hydrolyzing carbamoyl-phosphate synthase small subunit [Candidatus Neomarinimicrobiota bacterium]
MKNLKTAVLLLKDGRFFIGKSFGAGGESIGEVCFNTGMTGYQEILTDPSYCKQIVTMTFPHIGNYGVNPEDIESDRIQVAGFVIKEESVTPSNWRSTQSIGDYLRSQNIVGIQGIDTRALTRHIRNQGAMNGIISTIDSDLDSLEKKLEKVPDMTGLDLAKEVTCENPYSWSSINQSALPAEALAQAGNQSINYKVAVIDFGIKYNILRLLESHGCDSTVFPARTSSKDLVDFNPDGILLSNGPGDPAAVKYGIETVKDLLGKKPIFGICLGHQILALALGAKTFKLKFGHRGINHPVKNLETGIVEITSQNHGFAVDSNSLPDNVIPTHVNLNDNTLEGIRCKDIPAFSVQYHPESSPGPHDSRYLFQQFIKLMDSHKATENTEKNK